MNLVGWLRPRASLVMLLTIAAVAAGVVAIGRLPSGIYPEVTFPRVVVVAHVGDQPPELVETVATRPLEEALITIPGVRRLRSRTIRGAVELSIQFEPRADMERALQRCESRVAEVRGELPADTELQVERVMPEAVPVVTYNLHARSMDPRDLRDVATRVLRPALSRIAGVGEVEVQGGDVREDVIILRPTALTALHLTPSMVADRLAAQDLSRVAGRVADEHQTLPLVVDAQALTLAELAALPIARGPAGPIPLGAIADVIEGHEDRRITVAGRGGDAVVVSVARAAGASTPDVVARTRAVLRDLRAAGALPAGVEVRAVYDESNLVHDAMTAVRDAILIGIALSLVVLAVFLRDLRAGLAAAIAVPLTLVATFAVMDLAGLTLNLMSLGGLAVAIGLVVDDAIVIVEAIMRRREDGLDRLEAAERGTMDLLAAVAGTTLTTVVVFAPLVLIAGVVGSFLGALATTLCAAVLLSLVVAVTVVPLAAGAILGEAPRRSQRLAHGYGAILARLLRHPWLALGLVIVVIAIGAGAGGRVATGFLPAMDEGAFVLDFFLPPGTSLEETDRVARAIDGVLAADPSVVDFTRRTGAEMGPATATQQNTGDIMVRLVARDRRPPVEEVIDRIREAIDAEVPEARVEFVQVLQDVLGDLAGNPQPIEIRIFGDDPRILEATAREVAGRIEDLPMLLDLFDGVEGEVPSLRVAVDRAVASRLGVDPSAIADDLEVAVTGRVVAEVRLADRAIPVRVRFPDELRFDAEKLAATPLAYGPSTVAIGAITRSDRPPGPSVRTRENLRPVVTVTAAVRGGDLGGAERAVQARLAGLTLPPGVHLEIGGQAEGARETRSQLALVFGLGSALVLAVLLLQLRSLRLALVVLLGAPLAVVGALVTLAITGLPLDASSLMGCVLLAGLVVKNGILLLEHAGDDITVETLVAAGERRLRPILMTTAATIAGLAPLALGLGAGSELQRPLAVATIGGLVASTAVTLFVVPSLALLLMRQRRHRQPAPAAGS